MEQKKDHILEMLNSEFDTRVQGLFSAVQIENEIFNNFIKTCRDLSENVSYCTEIKRHHNVLLNALDPMKTEEEDNEIYQLSLNVMLVGILKYYYLCMKKCLDCAAIHKGIKEDGQRIDLVLEMSLILNLLDDLKSKITDKALKELHKEVEKLPKSVVDYAKAKHKANNPGCAAVILVILIPTILSLLIF